MPTKTFQNIPLSVLDLSPITEGSTPAQSFKNSVDLAQHVEDWGFNRYWLAEHHNMPGVASSATSVLIGHIAQNTKHIRVGAGGIMLPNHAPIVIAEQFGTLESLFPGRIDLGLGRAPGGDQATAYALRRTLHSSGDDFPEQLEELLFFFENHPDAYVQAYPGAGVNIPIWLLGSSGFSAQLAAMKGMPFSFASHFSPGYTMQALQLYRDHFTPSETLEEPYVMVGVNVIAAETEERAKWLATTQQQYSLSLTRGLSEQVKPPVKNIDEIWNDYEKAAVERKLDPRATIVGNPDQVRQKLESFLNETKANEIIICSQIYDHHDRLKSYEIVAEMME